MGFIFFKTNSSPERGSSTSSESITITVYDSVLVNGNSITAQEKGGEYLFACHITGILEPDFDTPFYVRAFSVVDGTVKYMTVKTVESVGLPINYWTAEELAYKAIKDTIVESISARQISRYLKEIDLKIHQFEGWLNLKDKLKDPEEFERRTDMVQIYLNSNNLQQEGFHILSCNEKTGIQAIEHKYPSKPARPSEIEICDFSFSSSISFSVLIILIFPSSKYRNKAFIDYTSTNTFLFYNIYLK